MNFDAESVQIRGRSMQKYCSKYIVECLDIVRIHQNNWQQEILSTLFEILRLAAWAKTDAGQRWDLWRGEEGDDGDDHDDDVGVGDDVGDNDDIDDGDVGASLKAGQRWDAGRGKGEIGCQVKS